jgi:hypothetical protein
MLNDKQPVRKTALARGLVAVAASAILAGCAMHEGGQRMQMGAMHESPMHQMMEEMGCTHDSSQMQAMKKMMPEERHAHMKSHMQECKAKMRQRATDEAMAKINACVEEQMSNRHAKRMTKKNMRAMMANIRANKTTGSGPTCQTKPHDGH